MSRRRLVLAAAAIAAIVALSRLPFVTERLWAWDSVLYARALERGFHVDFDLSDQRPQPPGYILYVATADALRVVTADSNAALVLLSAIASGLGAAAVFLLARRFARAPVALAVTAAFAANPLVWTYGEVAYPYAVLAFLSVALALVFREVRHSTSAAIWLATFALGLLAGYRQDLLLLLAGLWVWLVWHRSWRERLVAVACGALGCLMWFVPTAALSDGLEGYLFALSQQTDSVRTSYSVPAQGVVALWYNLRFTVYALAWGLLAFGLLLVALSLAPLLFWARTGIRWRGHPFRRLDETQSFFLAWIVPGLVFYVAVHIGEWGYVLSILPALYVAMAALLQRPLDAFRGVARQAAPAVLAACALAPALLFLGAPVRFSADALRSHDRAIAARVEYVRAHFEADRTVILAREDFLIVRYYLPEYRAWLYDPEPYQSAARQKRFVRTSTIVIFTEGLVPRQSLDVRYAEAGPGVVLAYIPIEPGSVLEFYGDRYTVREPR